jgi:flagellar protein FlgJ
MIPPLSTPPARSSPEARHDEMLMQKSQALEAAFLAEMLSFTGLGETSDDFGGGAGEEQFASFLRQEQARLMVERGGIGLSQQIFEQLKTKEGGNHGTG